MNASFYQFLTMLEYKSKLNDKLFVKVNPDIQAAQTILKRGLEVFGLGTNLCTSAKAKSKSLLISEILVSAN